MQTLIYLNKKFWFFNKPHLIAFLMTALLSTGCLPEDTALPQGSVTGGEETFSGFEGLETVETLSSTQLRLNWTPSTDPRVVAYNIYDVTLFSIPKLVKTVSGNRNSATLAGLSQGFYYSFRVRAVDEDGNEDTNKNDMVGIPFGGLQAVQVLSSTSARVTFSGVNQTEATEVNVYCKSSSNQEYTRYANIRNLNLTTADLTGLVASETYTCIAYATVEGVEDTNTNEFTFVPLGQADSIVFATEPGNGAAGDQLSVQPVVHILDDNGNIVSGGPDASALVTLVISPASPTVGAIQGTFTTNAVGGIATFTDLSINEAGIKILRATKEDTSAQTFGSASMEVDSNTFNVTAGSVSPLLTTIEISPAVPPANALVANGSDNYSVIITLQDEFGNPVAGTTPQFGSNIVGDFIIQPFLPTDAAGVTQGSISSTVADTNPARILNIVSPAGLNTVQTLAPFVPGPASRLAFSRQPTNSPAGALAMSEIRVAIQDAQGNMITSGAAASSNVTMAIASNVGGATLSGTTSVNAVNGEAIFADLGIDITDTGYRLVASSGALTPAFSNSFNVEAGIPRAIAIFGATSALSAECSGAITIQLQDLGANPANALSNTTVQLSGLGGASLYTSSTCGGAPIGTNVTYTPGTSTKTYYLRGSTVEALTITGTDASTVLTPGALNFNVNPNKIRIEALLPSPPAPANTPLRVAAGKCSDPIVITPLADDGTPGPVLEATNVLLNGVVGSQARFFRDAACTNEIDPGDFSLDQNAMPNPETVLYMMDPRGETLNINVADPTGDMTTTSLPQEVIVTASDLDLSGPTLVVAGQCSTAFQLRLLDTLGNEVAASGAQTYNLKGVNGSSATGQFYTSPACGGGGTQTTVIVPDATSSVNIYFRGNEAEVLDISIEDLTLELAESQTIQLTISPSALRFSGPTPAESDSSRCAGPLDIEPLDGLGTVANAVTPISVNLSGAGVAGAFYTDSDCESLTANVTIAGGSNLEQVYFRGHYPDNLTLTASDAAAVLSSGVLAWQVNAEISWLGTASAWYDESSNPYGFVVGSRQVSAAYDGIRNGNRLAFSADGNYLYVAEYSRERISKINYTTGEYVGWIGRLRIDSNIGSTGSSLSTPSPAQCISTTTTEALPGWCLGGRSQEGYETVGGLNQPYDMVEDGTYLYVTNQNEHSINRYNAVTGAFDGWIGWIENTRPTGNATGGPASCSVAPTQSVTPGWCVGGQSGYHDDGWPITGDGRMRNPRGLAQDATYLYVGTNGAVMRFQKSDGSFQGWIGRVNGSSPTGGAAGCTITGSNQITPGWCTGGEFRETDPANYGGGGVHDANDVFIEGNNLYVVDSTYDDIVRYDKTTGAFLEILPGVSGYDSPRQMAGNGSSFFIADNNRILQVDSTGLINGWMGKVASNAGMAGNAGCNTLQPNDDTPGWCIGGLHKGGMGETSFRNASAVAYDGVANILVGSNDYPGIKKFDALTGNYLGTVGLRSTSPRQWSDDATSSTEGHGFDDYSMYSPMGGVVEGDFLYIAEFNGSRIKKINKFTGELVGWVGGMTSKPTAGESAACSTANGMGPSPGWCLDADFYPTFTWNNASMIDDLVAGIMYQPWDIASDGTWIYVTDYGLHRIHKYRISDGSYGGWLGRVNTTPTGGAAGCTATGDNTFTPGWCIGGRSESGNGDGHLYNPTGIEYAAGNLYVIDGRNHRVSSYNAITGAFNGWIGRINATPPSGCTVGSNGDYNVSQSGWCRGGTSRDASDQDRGGGFRFNGYRGDIAFDGTYLYVANSENQRIDKINLSGEFIETTRTWEMDYTKVWTSDSNVFRSWRDSSMPNSIWVDANYIYGTTRNAATRTGDTHGYFKIDKATGAMVGWKGGIDPLNQPTGGDPGCVGANGYTPGWCQGGRISIRTQMGGFYLQEGAVTGDDHFIYAIDRNGNRVTRMPK